MVHLKRVTWKQRRFDDFEILLDISVLSKLTFKSDVFSAFFGSLSTWQDQVQFGYEMREVEEQVVGGCDLWYFTPTHETQQSPIITVTFGDCPTPPDKAEVAAKALSEHMMSLKLWDECLGAKVEFIFFPKRDDDWYLDWYGTKYL